MKAKIAVFCLLIMALNFSSCETFVNAIAEQTGRNVADALWDKTVDTEQDDRD